MSDPWINIELENVQAAIRLWLEQNSYTKVIFSHV